MFGVFRHGCLAGKYVEAYKFYRYGIAQDWRGFDTEMRGAVSDALNAVSSFFRNESYDEFVDELAGKLDDFDKAWLLSRASYCLESQGMLRDAVAPRRKSNDIYKKLYCNAKEASYAAFERARDTAFGLEQLAGIQMRLGQLEKAEEIAREAVRWADVTAESETKSRNARTWVELNTEPDHMPDVPSWLRQCSTRSVFGAVLHRLGKLDKAFDTLEEARKIKKENKPQWVLHSEPGVRYCMLQLDRAKTPAEHEDVLSHANEMLRWSDRSESQSATEIIKGLHYLIKGRALAELRHINEAQDTLNDAINFIRHSNKRQFLYETLLARAAVQRLNRNINGAEMDVNEVLESSQDCEMRLYQADAYLLDGHIALDLTDVERAKKDLEVANDLINRMSYRLRVAELHLLTARLEHLRNPSNIVVKQHLDKAYDSLNDINYGRLLQQWEKYKTCFEQTGEVCLRWGPALPEQICHP